MKNTLTYLFKKLSLITKTIESAEDCYVNFIILENTINKKLKIAEISNVSLNTFKFACLYQAIMNLCKVFVDRMKNSYTINKLFNNIYNKSNEFYNPQLVINTINNLRSELKKYTDSIERLKKRRNKMYAHNDKRYFGEIEKIQKELPLFFADKECLIEYGINATNQLRKLFAEPNKKIVHSKIGDNKDFYNTINFIEKHYKK